MGMFTQVSSQTACEVKIRDFLWSEDKEVQGIRDFTLVLA